MSEIKNAVVTSVQGNGTWDSQHGTLYKWEVSFENGDVGEYLSKATPQTKFVIGQPAYYSYETRQTSAGTFYKVRPAQDPNAQPSFSGGNKEKANIDWDAKDRRIVRQNALGHSVNLVVNNKIDLTELFTHAEQFENWVYREDKQPTFQQETKTATAKANTPNAVGNIPPQPPIDIYTATNDDLPF